MRFPQYKRHFMSHCPHMYYLVYVDYSVKCVNHDYHLIVRKVAVVVRTLQPANQTRTYIPRDLFMAQTERFGAVN